MIESSANLKPWREAVKIAAIDAMNAAGWQMLDEPVVLVVDFYLKRPDSTAKRVVHQFKKPDLSKLVRSTEDALTDAGIYADDARIIELIARKHFAIPPHYSGASIWVGTLDAVEQQEVAS